MFSRACRTGDNIAFVTGMNHLVFYSDVTHSIQSYENIETIQKKNLEVSYCTYGFFLSVRAEAELLLFLCEGFLWRVRKKVEREPETDPQGTL